MRELSFSYDEFVPPLFHQLLDIDKTIEASHSNSSPADRDGYETAEVSKLLFWSRIEPRTDGESKERGQYLNHCAVEAHLAAMHSLYENESSYFLTESERFHLLCSAHDGYEAERSHTYPKGVTLIRKDSHSSERIHTHPKGFT